VISLIPFIKNLTIVQ